MNRISLIEQISKREKYTISHKFTSEAVDYIYLVPFPQNILFQ